MCIRSIARTRDWFALAKISKWERCGRDKQSSRIPDRLLTTLPSVATTYRSDCSCLSIKHQSTQVGILWLKPGESCGRRIDQLPPASSYMATLFAWRIHERRMRDKLEPLAEIECMRINSAVCRDIEIDQTKRAYLISSITQSSEVPPIIFILTHIGNPTTPTTPTEAKDH